ncbi:type II toxin-antitoxin system VapC family toxin [Geodermatophilus sp. SYSU D00965]
MIVYLDTSAIVPLVIDEPSSDLCRRLWEAADAVSCCRLGYVEAAAALARAVRLGRVAADQHAAAVDRLDQAWARLSVLPIDEDLVREAAGLTVSHALRGYDAVHCAAALRLAGIGVTAVSGDEDLLTAWRSEGLQVVDTNA